MESISPYILPVLIVIVVVISIVVFLKFKLKKKSPTVALPPLPAEKEAQAVVVSQHIASYLEQGFDIKEMRLQAAAQEIDMDIWERAEEIVAESLSKK